jgi:inner membrane protein involved in colicin E2 resistance
LGKNIQAIHYAELYNNDNNLMVHFTDSEASEKNFVSCKIEIDINTPSLTILNCMDISGLAGSKVARIKIFNIEPGVQNELTLISYL